MARRITFAVLVASGLAVLAMSQAAHATAVACGDLVLGTRTMTVDPALVGGVCYAQNGNLDAGPHPNAFETLLASLGAVELDKDIAANYPTGDNSEGALKWTPTTGTSGDWWFSEGLWDTNARLFIAFHFGGAGDTTATNPDSFFVELAPRWFAGTYALGGGTLQGLSNIYLFGIRCTNPDGCNPPPPPQDVPEPGTLALLGLGLLGLGAARRKAA